MDFKPCGFSALFKNQLGKYLGSGYAGGHPWGPVPPHTVPGHPQTLGRGPGKGPEALPAAPAQLSALLPPAPRGPGLFLVAQMVLTLSSSSFFLSAYN